MSFRKHLEQMVETGAVLQLPDGTNELLGGIRHLPGPVLRWCRVHPADQGAITHTPYAHAVLVHGRDVLFTNADGEMVAYVSPLRESPMDTDEEGEVFAKWRELVTMPHNAEYWEHFMDMA